LPATSTFIAMAIVWQFLLHGRIGPINEWLVSLGLNRIDFLTDPSVALFTLSFIGAWQLIGQTTVLFLAGLASIPQDICDAAELDGMDYGWDRFIRITFPMLAPTTLFIVVTTTITTFQAFDSIAALTKGGPAGSTETLLYRIYLEAYQYTNMGYASALSIVFLTFIVLFSLAQIFIADRRIHY
jgi:multiple sugar transport system permease protein